MSIAKWVFGAALFAAIALHTDVSAWMLPAVVCAVVAIRGVFCDGR